MLKTVFLGTILLSASLIQAHQPLKQFSYAYQTEFAYNEKPGFQLNPDIEAFAQYLYADMGKSVLFDATLIRDPEATREYHLKPKHIASHNGQILAMVTQDGLAVDCTFFDRGSDTLLIVGEGFTNERENVTSFVDMFPEYDIVLFDFRGHGFQTTDDAWESAANLEENDLTRVGSTMGGLAAGSIAALLFYLCAGDRSSGALALVGGGIGILTGIGSYNYQLFNRIVNSLTKKGFGIDPARITFGEKEHLDVIAVVDGFKKLRNDRVASQPHMYKSYKQVLGLGICYSAFIFLKTVAEQPGLFDKVVLDGCWLSLPLFVEKVKNDLLTLVNPQTGGWATHPFFGRQDVKDAAEWIARKIVNLQLNDISLVTFAPKVKNTSVLFFHGRDDYMVHRHEFEQLWDLLTIEKNVVLTSNPHVRNHLKQKELYKLVCDLYFQLPQATMVKYLSNKNELVGYYKQKFDQFLDPVKGSPIKDMNRLTAAATALNRGNE